MMRLLSNVSSQISILNVPISFAHTVKAMMPIFTVALSRYFLKTKFTTAVYVSLIPIVCGASDACCVVPSSCHTGVFLASMTEISFNITGLISALIATITFAVQNIYTKKVSR